MNFRELTNQECEVNRQWKPTEANRTELESKVLETLNDSVARYIQSGGSVKQCPGNGCKEVV